MRVAVIFPGQGNQAAGLGRPWKGHPAWDVVVGAEAATGESFTDLLLDATADDLARTREAQLSVLLSSLLAWHALDARLHEAGATVTAFAGHSLGQITALIAAEVLEPGEGVRLAARRAELTQAAADTAPGRMAALLGASAEQLASACAAAPDACWPANINAPGQVVIAGTPAGLDAACAAARDAGVRKVMPLNVGGAFHTPLMQPAADAFGRDLAATRFAPGRGAVVSNTDGAAYTDPGGWSERLREHLVRPVQWQACMETIAAGAPDLVLEVGPGSTLAGLAKRITPDLRVVGVSTPEDVEHALSPQEPR